MYLYKIYYSRTDGESICAMCAYKNSDGTCNNIQKIEQEKNNSTTDSCCTHKNCCEYFRELVTI